MPSKWRLYASLFVVFMPLWAWGDDTPAPRLTVKADVLFPQGKAALTVSLSNPGDDIYNGYQFDLRLPDGFTLATKDNKDDEVEYVLSDRYSTSRANLNITDKGDGHYRLLFFSFNNTVITGNDGPLLTIYLLADDDMAEGTYHGAATGISLSRNDGISVSCPRATFDIQMDVTMMGDVNIDHVVDVTDVMKTVLEVLRIQQTNFHVRYADMDRNGVVDVTDVMTIIDVILHKI